MTQQEQQEQEKMSEVVGNLWQNPNLSLSNPVEKENQILALVSQNAPQLQNTFSQPSYFPGKPWDQVLRLLLTILTEKVIAELDPLISATLEHLYESGVVYEIRNREGFDLEREKFAELLQELCKQKGTRDQVYYSLALARSGKIDDYVPEFIGNRKNIYNQVVRAEKLTFETELVSQYIIFCLLFRPFVWYKYTRGNSTKQMSLDSQRTDYRLFSRAAGELAQELAGEGSLPKSVFATGLESCLNVHEHDEVNGVSRLINIFAHYIVEYNPNQKVERGAETPDKSWFNIHRRSAKYFGFDVRFLDELYQIADARKW